MHPPALRERRGNATRGSWAFFSFSLVQRFFTPLCTIHNLTSECRHYSMTPPVTRVHTCVAPAPTLRRANPERLWWKIQMVGVVHPHTGVSLPRVPRNCTRPVDFSPFFPRRWAGRASPPRKISHVCIPVCRRACPLFYLSILTTHEITPANSFLLVPSLPTARHDTRGCCGVEEIQTASTS